MECVDEGDGMNDEFDGDGMDEERYI